MRMSPRASGIARVAQPGTPRSSGKSAAAPAQPSVRAPSVKAGSARGQPADVIRSPSGERDVGRALVVAARGVEEPDLELAGIGRPEAEREERVLAHGLSGLEGD